MSQSLFNHISAGVPDAILGITEAFRADSHPSKVNLGVGIYQDAEGKVPVLEAIKRAAQFWSTSEDNKSYLPIDGLPTYNLATQELIFGKGSPLISGKRIATIQSVGGSGALKLAIDFIRNFFPGTNLVLSDPSWENHRVIFEAAGVKVDTYPYYDPSTNGLKAPQMLDALNGLAVGTAVLLHACCHNPTGVDLPLDCWERVATICQERRLIPLIDCAYQGFGDGLEADVAPIRMFAEKNLTFFVASSYAKSFSIYRERVGALSVVTGSSQETANVISQLKRIVRTIYSSPPSYGAQLVSIVLTNPELRSLWEKELTAMRQRIQEMRELFATRLGELVSDRDFSFIRRQTGMFSYSGLSAGVIRELRERYHIYALESGRICVAAMNHKNMEYICSAIAAVIRERTS